MQRDQKAHLGALTLDDALAFIQDRSVDLLHDTSVESEAFYRTQKYPAQIKSSLHHAVVTIPRRLAYVLHQNPAYISPAVEAFYLRDPIALRPLQSRRSQTFFFAPEDFVTVSVKFTKVGYAQLRGQEFETPPAWAGSATNNPREDQSAKQMGMKLTCGFEMLLSDPQNVDKKPVREMKLLLEDLIAGDEQLPSNDDISRWECIQDDESWLDINFEDFERELSGTGDQIPLRGNAGFGDRTAHDNLRKIVARFENFLKDEDELAEDAEFLDDMDNDDGSDTADGTASHDSESDNGEREGDFDEARFASMMRDMMGLPPSAASDTVTKNGPKADSGAIIGESDGSIEGESDASIEEEREMRRVMDDMEIELRQAGALSLDPPSTQETLGLTNS